ncbi:MAG: glycoside hydrolase family 2 TIM barrel-domain containing protein [Sediminibacterium sp.]
MKKTVFFSFFFIVAAFHLSAQDKWQIVPGRIQTPWAEKVDPSHVLPEYPRPQLVRRNWQNLNGLWQYAILPKEEEGIPKKFDGPILVPYAVESALSGVGKTVGKDSVLWYQRNFVFSPGKQHAITLLHFGAVDWQCDVFVNGKKVGTHQGGYDPFSLDISAALTKEKLQEIAVRVWDPTDDGPQPRGKQVKKPNSIWYTPVTGIWQTVWLEEVAPTHIEKTQQVPDVDQQVLLVSAQLANRRPGDVLKITAWDGNTLIAEKSTNGKETTALQIPNAKLWSPDHPFLYTLKFSLVQQGKVVDEADSYFAMRKISIAPDNKGIQRMMLNNRFVFEYGPLDQGWWPDGLYTAPTDEALKFDIEKTKSMGFNMIRKHVKVEPARWYYYCDLAGMLVWQDMPSGDLGNRWEPRPGVLGRATDKARTPESESYYRKEWNAIINALYNYPSIVVWTPFNEAWGQFKTKEIVNWTMQKDPSRLVNTASGGNFEAVGAMIDLHNYPDPSMPDPDTYGTGRALVLGEFGGLGMPVEHHTWQSEKNWGYQSFKNKEELYKRYAELVNRFPELIQKGLSAAVYTQTTDVEVEVNGLMTYDRKLVKMPEEKLRELHQQLYAPAHATVKK